MNPLTLVSIMECFFLQQCCLVWVGTVVWVGICDLLNLGAYCDKPFKLLKFLLRNQLLLMGLPLYVISDFSLILHFTLSILYIQCFNYDRLWGVSFLSLCFIFCNSHIDKILSCHILAPKSFQEVFKLHFRKFYQLSENSYC